MPEIKMLDHQKMILRNVMHDDLLFEKELTKSIRWLEAKDVHELHTWLQTSFWKSHKKIIQKVFKKEAA